MSGIADRLARLEQRANAPGPYAPKQSDEAFEWDDFFRLLAAHSVTHARQTVDTPRAQIRDRVEQALRQHHAFYAQELPPADELERQVEEETERITSLTAQEWWDAVCEGGYAVIWRDRRPPGVVSGATRNGDSHVRT
jgi:hypothetical protein